MMLIPCLIAFSGGVLVAAALCLWAMRSTLVSMALAVRYLVEGPATIKELIDRAGLPLWSYALPMWRALLFLQNQGVVTSCAADDTSRARCYRLAISRPGVVLEDDLRYLGSALDWLRLRGRSEVLVLHLLPDRLLRCAMVPRAGGKSAPIQADSLDELLSTLDSTQRADVLGGGVQ